MEEIQTNVEKINPVDFNRIDENFLTKATLAQRVLAFFIDNFILLTITVIILVYVLKIDFTEMLIDRNSFANLVFGVFLFHQTYFFLFEFLLDGRTIGKWIIKIKVTRSSGKKLNFLSSLIRNFTRAIYFFPPLFCLPDCICYLLTSNEKRIGDLIAGTIVIKSN
ncbi:MAG: RDD family protein [Ignavibacteriales bacterium]|nr:RDD family protein [Ignavibacteriales bacterium]